MTRKISFLLTILLSTLVSVGAQTLSGRWSLYPTVGASITSPIDTGSKVFYLSSGRLFHYSEADQETLAYSSSGYLSDVEVSKIFYNPDTKQLLVVYTNSNLDIIGEDGTVQNVSDLRDAILSSTKGVVDVAFKGPLAYMATDFGLVVLNMQNGTVQQSGIYGFAPTLVCVTDDYLLLYFANANNSAGIKANTFYSAPRTGKLTNFSVFKAGLTEAIGDVVELTGSTMVTLSRDMTRTRVMTVDPTSGQMSQVNRITDAVYKLTRGFDGRVYAMTETNVRAFDPATGTIAETASLAPGATGYDYAFGKKGMSDAWHASKAGLAKYDLSSGTTLMGAYTPEGISVRYPHSMVRDKNGRLWIYNMGAAILKTNTGGMDAVKSPIYVASIEEDGKLVDRTPTTDVCGWTIGTGDLVISEMTPDEKARAEANLGAMQWPAIVKIYNMNTKYIIGGPNTLLPDPDDPDKFWITTAMEGIYLCKNRGGWTEENKLGDVIGYYSRINMPYEHYPAPTPDGVYTRMYGVDADPEGNLWFFYRSNSGERVGPQHFAAILPANIRKTRPENVKYEDWIMHYGMENPWVISDVKTQFSSTSNMLFLISSAYAGPLYAIDTKGTYTRPEDDKVIAHQGIMDQDGNPISPIYYTDVIEDKEGQIWVTTTSGLFVITDPNSAATEGLRVRRPVVPRNDGTNYGDYLLDGANISCIAVDPTNRKWVGTSDGGLYLVSADGTKVISHFDTSNSPLVSNTIYSVNCDPNSSRVYIGTDLGVMTYDSDASPAEPDYSDVYIYPNPVRPEYNGWITVAGLMDNSLVKIVDMGGNVVAQGRSNGGSFVWDGCNTAGKRVRTGVYLVLASTSGGDDFTSSGSAAAMVGKIMIMN